MIDENPFQFGNNYTAMTCAVCTETWSLLISCGFVWCRLKIWLYLSLPPARIDTFLCTTYISMLARHPPPPVFVAHQSTKIEYGFYSQPTIVISLTVSPSLSNQYEITHTHRLWSISPVVVLMVFGYDAGPLYSIQATSQSARRNLIDTHICLQHFAS